MMRLLDRTTLLITAFVAALCLAAPGFAAEPEDGEIMAWIEAVHPEDALAGDAPKIVVLRQGKAVTFPPGAYMAALYADDLIRINDADAYMDLCADTGRLRVTAETAGKGGYHVKGQTTTVLKNFAAWLGDLSGRNREARLVSARTRGAGQDEYPAILDDPDVDFKLAAGTRALHVRWKGGEALFRVLLLKGDEILSRADSPKGRSVVLPKVSLAPGEYELVIKDKKGLGPEVDPLRGNADQETLIVVAAEALPRVPKELAEAPLPDEARRLLYADWLAREEGGAWLLEARQIAAALAETYAPARDWPARWGGE